jgi:hypothetical protein
MLRLDRRTDDQQELTRIGPHIDELPMAPSEKYRTVRTDADCADIDGAHLTVRGRNVDANESRVYLRLSSIIAIKINLNARTHQHS